MTALLYQKDPYMRTFGATIIKAEGDKVLLDRTAFYPGGGGQEADRGTINGLPVSDIIYGEEIIHVVPGNDFQEGQEVECEIDWERRYDLMRGHTAEHLIFSEIGRRVENMELVKISIGPSKKSLMVNGEINWKLIGKVQGSVNDLISQSLAVREIFLMKDDPVLEDIRIKSDRIKGEKIRVVRIGEVDAAACAGIHVANTSEIGTVLISGMGSARPAGDYEITFDVGEAAVSKALDLAHFCLIACEASGSHPEDLQKAILNLRGQLDLCSSRLRDCSRELLGTISPESYKGFDIYSGIFSGVDKREFISTANELLGKNSACVLISRGENILMVVACDPELGIDCREILKDALALIGGRGGGKPSFATGGAPSGEGGERVLEKAVSMMKSRMDDIAERFRS